MNTDNTAVSALRSNLSAAEEKLKLAVAGKEGLLGKQELLLKERTELEKQEKEVRRARVEAESTLNGLRKELRLAEEELARKQAFEQVASGDVERKREEQARLCQDITGADEGIRAAHLEVSRIQQELRDLETPGQRVIREKRAAAGEARSQAWDLEKTATAAELKAKDARRAAVTFPSLKSTLIGEAEKEELVVSANRAKVVELKAEADRLDTEAKAVEVAEAEKFGEPAPKPTTPVSAPAPTQRIVSYPAPRKRVGGQGI